MESASDRHYGEDPDEIIESFLAALNSNDGKDGEAAFAALEKWIAGGPSADLRKKTILDGISVRLEELSAGKAPESWRQKDRPGLKQLMKKLQTENPN